MDTEQVAQLDYDARPLYRVRRPIAYGKRVIPVGCLHRLDKIPAKGIERMANERRSIVEVNPPPLGVLPGWERRGERFASVGIENAVQFLGVDVQQAATYLRVKPATIERWKGEVQRWLTPDNGKR